MWLTQRGTGSSWIELAVVVQFGEYQDAALARFGVLANAITIHIDKDRTMNDSTSWRRRRDKMVAKLGTCRRLSAGDMHWRVGGRRCLHESLRHNLKDLVVAVLTE